MLGLWLTTQRCVVTRREKLDLKNLGIVKKKLCHKLDFEILSGSDLSGLSAEEDGCFAPQCPKNGKGDCFVRFSGI